VGDLVQSATAILSGAQQRAEEAAHNISNMATPGYRARRTFAQVVSQADVAQGGIAQSAPTLSMKPGGLSETGNPLDVAIGGEGFFELRGETGSLFTRNGQFSRADDGRLLGPGGRAVQGAGGGDLILTGTEFTISANGDLLEGDRTIGRLSIMTFDVNKAVLDIDGLLTVSPADRETVDAPLVRQGFLESSNVALGDEMIGLMEAVRRAETGQRLMNVYDDLMGRAVTTFGQAS